MTKTIIILQGGKGSGNWGHKGRKGMVGGSAQTDDGSGDDVPDSWEKADTTLKKHGGFDPKTGEIVQEEHSVYLVGGDADKVFDKGKGLVAVAVKGEHKGDVLYVDSNYFAHSQMIRAMYPEESQDNWVRFMASGRKSENVLYADPTTSAQNVYNHPRLSREESLNVGIENIYKAGSVLSKKGMDSKTNLFITMPIWVKSRGISTIIGKAECPFKVTFLWSEMK